ncbi:hypothetical protein CBR_g955 [Chara braunii]|uniref:RRM domain-containing protein n=1 Tax=Chara braunii TaxID=69332 RepID=A0A388KCP1_CHABU|nr:hypothetical protein CBR_g955 [Chara braunii]|eukprot:GBG67834.1 hypothetical protein CBR_g955 [Chara braunii]
MARNNAATLFLGNLEERVDERLIYEIMVQAGPVVDVHIPRDKETQRHKGYGFAEFASEESAQYAFRLFSGLIVLYNRSVRVGMAGGGDKKPSASAEEDSTVQATITPPAESAELLSSVNMPIGMPFSSNSGFADYATSPGAFRRSAQSSQPQFISPTYSSTAHIPPLTRAALYGAAPAAAHGLLPTPLTAGSMDSSFMPWAPQRGR